MLEIINGDLFNSNETWIIQQCNCVTNRSAGLSKEVFKRYPKADIYRKRTKPDKPGNITIHYGDKNIINLLAQYYPGKPSYRKTMDNLLDDTNQRIEWFKNCLKEISRHADEINEKYERSVAVPYGIGCGLAGGNWTVYLSLLKEFSERYKFHVKIYKLN